MQDVQINRQTWGLDSCRECVGAIALLSCDHLGDRVYVTYETDTLGPYHVVDCAAKHHRARLSDTGWVADLPYELAERWGMQGPIWITVTNRTPVDPLERRGKSSE